MVLQCNGRSSNGQNWRAQTRAGWRAAACGLAGALGCGGWAGDAAWNEATFTNAGSGLDTTTHQGEPACTGPVSTRWERQLEPAGASLTSRGVAADAAGRALVTGYTLKPLDGSPAASSDAFLALYSGVGQRLWTAELATPESDAAASVALDQDGNALIAGDTSGALEGSAHGFGDAFVAKYSPEGMPVWVRQVGSAAPDEALGVAADGAGNVFVTGVTRGALEGGREGKDLDAWIAKYSPAGEALWLRQLGSSPGYDDAAAGVDSDAEGNVLVAGYSFGALDGDNQGSADAFVAKLSGEGELLWIRQLGAADHDAAESVRADAQGNVFVAGQLGGNFVGGPGVVIPGSPFLAKYSPAGELLWSLPLAEGAAGSASSLAIDASGAAWIAGSTSADWGAPNQGSYDSFLARLSADGELLGVEQLGARELDQSTGLSVDEAGDVFLSRDIWNAGKDGADLAFLLAQRRCDG